MTNYMLYIYTCIDLVTLFPAECKTYESNNFVWLADFFEVLTTWNRDRNLFVKGINI